MPTVADKVFDEALSLPADALLALGCTFLIAAALVIFLVNHSMRKQALLKDTGLKSKPISATILRRS